MNKFITCKITLKECYIMAWDGLKIIDYQVFNKRFKQRIELFANLKHGLSVYDIIYYEDSSEHKEFLSGAMKINIHRAPFKKENYKNLKHQLYFYLIRYITSGKISIKCNIPKEQLKIELDQIKQHRHTTDDKLQILPRDKIIENIGHDINIVDCISYRLFAISKGIG